VALGFFAVVFFEGFFTGGFLAGGFLGFLGIVVCQLDEILF
jgi:hypothetical protein